MDFSLPEHVIQFKHEAREWVDTVLNPLSEPLRKKRRLPEELVSELRKGRFFRSHHTQRIRGTGMARSGMVQCFRRISKGLCHGEAHCPHDEWAVLEAS